MKRLSFSRDLNADQGTYEDFQQTQRDGIDKDGNGEYAQVQGDNPHQNKRHEPAEQGCLYEIEPS